MSPSNAVLKGGGGDRIGFNHMQHPVSKFDTLAGVAIKYGVEVADIKRLNGLATDLQMFALKTLKIPLPGRHPPSSPLSYGLANYRDNSTGRTLRHLPEPQSNTLEPFQSLRLKPPRQKVSYAMSDLQKYYGLKSSPNLRNMAEGTEMAVYRNGSLDHSEGEWLPKASPISDFYSNHHQNSRTSANGFLTENGAGTESTPSENGNIEGEKSVRRRQKSEVDSGAGTPEKLNDKNSGGSSVFSSSTGKGLAVRAKSASRTSLLADSELGWLDSVAALLSDSIAVDGLTGVRKSSSAPTLEDQPRNNSATAWTTSKWNLKPDFQALSSVAITKPIFEGLPIPITGRRNKAALD